MCCQQMSNSLFIIFHRTTEVYKTFPWAYKNCYSFNLLISKCSFDIKKISKVSSSTFWKATSRTNVLHDKVLFISDEKKGLRNKVPSNNLF